MICLTQKTTKLYMKVTVLWHIIKSGTFRRAKLSAGGTSKKEMLAQIEALKKIILYFFCNHLG
jgi:hypothetical protein